jgi:hypothetical protein
VHINLITQLKNYRMAKKGIKSITSKYRYVEIVEVSDKTYYRVSMKGVSKDSFKTEREAAIAADKILIARGKEPVNILKRK